MWRFEVKNVEKNGWVSVRVWRDPPVHTNKVKRRLPSGRWVTTKKGRNSFWIKSNGERLAKSKDAFYLQKEIPLLLTRIHQHAREKAWGSHVSEGITELPKSMTRQSTNGEHR